VAKPPLAGRRIALLETRLTRDLATLVERLGGVPTAAPAVREVPRADDLDAFVEGVTGRRFALAIFQTGVGAATLFRDAERRGRLDDVLAALRTITVACRGPKPLAVLTRHGVPPSITTAKPHTTHELLAALEPFDMNAREVLLVQYGERNAALVDALHARGARVTEVCPYVWALPEDCGPLERIVNDAIEKRIDAMLFTNQIQCRHLFEIAERMGVREALRTALAEDIVVGSVGPVVSAALRAARITPDVMPSSPNMASLITAVGDYFELTDD
jgi:uroporphyrinogen-III synthase